MTFAVTEPAFTSLVATWWPVAASSTFAVSGFVLGGRLVLRARHRRLMTRDARLIRIQAPAVVAADSAAAFWSHLHALLRPVWRRVLDGQPHLVFEYNFTERGTELGVWVPGVVAPGIVESAIEAAWPGARTSVLRPPPAPIPATSGMSTGGRLRLARQEVLPLRAKHDADPLRPLLGAGSGLGPGEYATVQVLGRPATGRRTRRFRRQLAGLRRAAAISTGPIGPYTARNLLFDTFTPGTSTQFQRLRTDPVRQAELRAAVSKNVGALWEVQIRYAAASLPGGDPDRLRGIAAGLAAAFGVFAERNWWARKRLARPVAALAERSLGRGNLLSVGELAACAHVPLDPFAPGITRAGARAVAPPPQIPVGVGKPLGDADAGPARTIVLNVEDGRRHLHILGATGCGKSTLMSRMIIDDVAAGRGVVVIDPKGDLVTDLLDRLPEDAGHRMHLIDPGAPGPHPSLNMLSTGDPDLVVDNLVGIFRRIFSASWGPRTDDVLRSTCLTLLAATRAPTLADVPELLTSKVLRRRVLAQLPPSRYPLLHGFWDGYNALSETGRAAVTAPLLNKLRAFLLRDFIRTLVAQPVSTIDLREVLDGGILLVRLPKGLLGEETARLLGSLIVAATWQAATARARAGESVRTDSALYIDEAHNFLNLPYPLEDMLAEARGYRMSMVLAHQNLAQMPADLREGISANARNKVFFACSPEDARNLATHVAPALSEHDLAHLDGYQAAVRLSVNGVQAPAFTLRTRPLKAPIPGRADRLRALCRERTQALRMSL